MFNLCNAYCVRIKWDNQVKALQVGVHGRSSITQAKKAEHLPPFFSSKAVFIKIFFQLFFYFKNSNI